MYVGYILSSPLSSSSFTAVLGMTMLCSPSFLLLNCTLKWWLLPYCFAILSLAKFVA